MWPRETPNSPSPWRRCPTRRPDECARGALFTPGHKEKPTKPQNHLSATAKTPAVHTPLYDFCFRTREVCVVAHKPCFQAIVCKIVRRSLSSCLEPELLRLVLCDFLLRPVWTCPRTKVKPRLSCSARTEPPGDKLDFGRKSCVTLPRFFSRPPSQRQRRCSYPEK